MKIIYESHLTEAQVAKQLRALADGLDPCGMPHAGVTSATSWEGKKFGAAGRSGTSLGIPPGPGRPSVGYFTVTDLRSAGHRWFRP